MSEYVFFAKLQPDHILYYLNYKIYIPLSPFSASMIFYDSVISFQANLLICNSDWIVTVTELKTQNIIVDNDEFLLLLKNVVMETVIYPVLDTLNYLLKASFDIDIISAKINSEKNIVFHPFLEEKSSHEENRKDRPFSEQDLIKQFESILNIFISNTANNKPIPIQSTHSNKILLETEALCKHNLVVSLSDLRRAIKIANCTPLFCYRAIEAIRRAVAKIENIDEDTQKEWEVLREKLYIDFNSLTVITRLSEQNRHAGFCPLSGESRKTIIDFTISIIDSYLLYIGHNSVIPKKKNNLTLEKPVVEFFHLPKIKCEIKKYLSKYPSESIILKSEERTSNIQFFLQCIELINKFKQQEVDYEKKDYQNKIKQLENQNKHLAKQLKHYLNKATGAKNILMNLEQEPTCNVDIKAKINKVIQLLTET